MNDIVTSTKESAGRRRAVLRVLRASGAAMSIVAIADQLGVHPNTVRFHLDTLVADGQVEHAQPDHNRPGRPPLLFQAVRQMDRGGRRDYQLLAEILAVSLAAEQDPSAKAQAAGRAWGQTLHPSRVAGSRDEAIDYLVETLDDLGFAPERRVSDGEEQIGLRHCPFLELAEIRTSVICPIHLGLMRGSLQTWAAPLEVAGLEAFVEPDLCVAHLASPTTPR